MVPKVSRSVHGNSWPFASNSTSFANNGRSLEGRLTVHIPCICGDSGPGFPMIKECGVPNNKPQIGYLVGEGKYLS